MEIIRSEEQKENNEEKWRKLKWVMGYHQETNTSNLGFPEWEERNKRPENLLKEIITENFQNLRKEMDNQIQKACCCSVGWLCPTL